MKTSNPSSKEFQDLFSVKLESISNEQVEITTKNVSLERNFIKMAKLVNDWSSNLEKFSSYQNMGVVVGATYPQELKEIRKIVRKSFILMPGYGAQGATVNEIKYGFQENGLGGIVNSSRGIIYAYNEYRDLTPEDFGKASRRKVTIMNEEINKTIGM